MIYGKTIANEKRIGLDIAEFLLKKGEAPVFMCIGSDKVVGDLLGVVIGETLNADPRFKGYVYGNLNCPINRKNIKSTLNEIRQKHPSSPIIVIDAVLGEVEEVGCVKTHAGGVLAGGQFGDGEMVGDYSVLGVVCTKGVSALNFLGCVRLNLVVDLCKRIVSGIKYSKNLCLGL